MLKDEQLRRSCFDEKVYDILRSFTFPINEHLDFVRLENPSQEDSFDIFSKVKLVDEDRLVKPPGQTVEADKRQTAWLIYKKRNNLETPEFYPKNIEKTSRGLVRTKSEEKNPSLILMNSSFEVTATEAIVDIGAPVPMVSRCALDEFRDAIENDYPDLYQRIIYFILHLR